MSITSGLLRALRSALVAVVLTPVAAAAAPAPPRPDPGGDLHILYGALPAGGEGPVLLFVHGLRGHAADWWVGNDMYALAHDAGYRTAFVNLSRDLTRNDAGVVENAAVLVDAIPKVADRYRSGQLYVVAHSKGALDAQAAIIRPEVSFLVKGVFMISPPNHGSELADWAFGNGRVIAASLGLLTPGVFALKTDNVGLFRAAADLVGARAGIPYFTMTGTTFQGNLLTNVTGRILAALTGGEVNDGFVTLSSAELPSSYATGLGELEQNHFNTDDGALAFPRIHAQLQQLEGRAAFTRIATRGFGDRQNSFAWSMKWFKGRLYVGVGRSFLCVTAATADAQTGSHLYRPLSRDLVCAPTPQDLPLAAEIWRYTPGTQNWQRVYRSPEDIPIEFDILGRPTKFTARDIAYRGMAIFEEADGTEALYVSGVSSGSMFGQLPPWGSAPRGYPPPRMLRSVDGVGWEALPQAPGTFLGDIGVDRPGEVQVEGFRSMVSFGGKLFVTATDFRGVGFLLSSSNPSAGNDAWRQASPSPDVFPIWTLYPWNGWLYMTTGDRRTQNGYGVYKTRAIGPGPYSFVPVVTDGALQLEPFRSPDALSLQAFGGKLYVGSNRPTELIRIGRDDTWELVVGGHRFTPSGRLLRPLSGLLTGFGNLFNGHFWRMGAFDGRLFLGTWDWSIGLRNFPRIGPLSAYEHGTDFFTTRDGRYWNVVTKRGFGDGFNYGVRSLQPTPAGLFVGTANPWYGLQVFLATSASLGNLDHPGSPGLAAGEPSAGALAAADLAAPLDPPERLESVSGELRDGSALLSWESSPGATAYHVYRSRPVPAREWLPADFAMEHPVSGASLTARQVEAGALQRFCADAPAVPLCELAGAIAARVDLPGPWERIATVHERWFVDESPAAPGRQALYYVVAADDAERTSGPSNLVGGPSAAAATTFALLADRLHGAGDDAGIGSEARAGMLGSILDRAQAELLQGDASAAARSLVRLEQELEAGWRLRADALEADPDGASDPDLVDLIRSLARHVFLVAEGLLPAESLLG